MIAVTKQASGRNQKISLVGDVDIVIERRNGHYLTRLKRPQSEPRKRSGSGRIKTMSTSQIVFYSVQITHRIVRCASRATP